MQNNGEKFVWSEKYRPQKIGDMVLPSRIKELLMGFIAAGDFPTLIFSGPPGVGKTTAAKALMNELDAEYMFINGSIKGNIDTLRNDIQSFASTVSFSGKRKYVIIDEADFLTQNTQAGLRGFTDEFADNCGFILTCNFSNRIMPAIADSRCVTIDFSYPSVRGQDADDAAALQLQMYKMCSAILTKEQIAFKSNVLAQFVQQKYPHWRIILNELQAYSVRGEIDSGILTNGRDIDIQELASILKKRNFAAMREWVGEHADIEPAHMYRSLYDGLYPRVDQQFIPPLIVLLGKYQYQDAHCADREINLAACLTELMIECSFV